MEKLKEEEEEEEEEEAQAQGPVFGVTEAEVGKEEEGVVAARVLTR